MPRGQLHVNRTLVDDAGRPQGQRQAQVIVVAARQVGPEGAEAVGTLPQRVFQGRGQVGAAGRDPLLDETRAQPWRRVNSSLNKERASATKRARRLRVGWSKGMGGW